MSQGHNLQNFAVGVIDDIQSGDEGKERQFRLLQKATNAELFEIIKLLVIENAELGKDNLSLSEQNDKLTKKTPLDRVLDLSITDLHLSLRTIGCYQNENINFVGELVQLTKVEALKTPNLGKKSLDETIGALALTGLTFGMKFPDWKPPVS